MFDAAVSKKRKKKKKGGKGKERDCFSITWRRKIREDSSRQSSRPVRRGKRNQIEGKEAPGKDTARGRLRSKQKKKKKKGGETAPPNPGRKKKKGWCAKGKP